MCATTESSSELLEATRKNMHPRCVVCGRPGPAGLGLEFHVQPDGSVIASFDCRGNFEGYDGMLHGGVISAIADGAMTNCLFAHGITAVTAELKVRFRHPIKLGTPLTVSAKITRRTDPLFCVEAELIQDSQLKVTATGKFLVAPSPTLNSTNDVSSEL